MGELKTKSDAPSSQKRARHAFYPGTFDPMHQGHLEIAKNAGSHVDKVWLLPNPVHSKSKPETTDIETRRELVRLFISEHPELEIPEAEAWEVYKQAYEEHGVDEAIVALAEHFNVDPVHVVGEDVYVRRDHSNREVLLVPRGDSSIQKDTPMMKVLPAVGDISSSAIRKSLAKGEEADGLPSKVYDEIKKRGLYEVSLPPEARIVCKWIYEKIEEWKEPLDSSGVHIELGGSLVSGLFVLDGAKNYDVDVKFIVDNPTDPEILKQIEAVTGLQYRKSLNIKELPEGKNASVLLEKVFEIPGVGLPVDVEGLVRQGPYFNSHKLYTKLFTPDELEAVRRKKRELQHDKVAYKKYKYEVRDELMKRAQAAGLI